MSWLSPARWLMIGGLILAMTLGYFAWADHIGDVREAKVRAEYKKQADAIDAKREAISAPIAAKAEAAQEKIRTVFKTITKEVTVYVKSTDCPLPGGFRVYHDAAANGEVPDPSRIPDASAVPVPDAAQTIAANYGACHETSQRLTDLQGWVRAQQGFTP